MNNTQTAPFNALDGQEMITVILDEIRKKLEDSGEFKPHRTYPLVRIRYSIGVNCYPTQELDAEPKVRVAGVVSIPPTTEVPTTEPEVKVELKDDLTIDTPDRARKSAKIPLKVPAPSAGRVNNVIVDKPRE